MFIKLTSKPMKIPMVDIDDDVTDNPTFKSEKDPILVNEESCSDTFKDALHQPEDFSEKNPSQNVMVVDQRLTYDNIQESFPKTEQNQLVDSLLTTKSQESLDLSKLSYPMSEKESLFENFEKLETDALSFRVSQIDMSDLNDMAFTVIQDRFDTKQTKVQSPTHAENVKADLQESNRVEKKPEVSSMTGDEAKDMNIKLESPRQNLYTKMILLLVLTTLAFYGKENLRAGYDDACKTCEPGVMITHSMNSTQLNTMNEVRKGKALNIKLDAERIHLFVEDHETKEEIINQELSPALNACILAIFVILFFSKLKKTQYTSSVPATKKEDGPVQKYDISKYEKLKVAELRDLLRKRGCKTIGKKQVLIKRLAAVNKAELETLTVVQLRKLLKTKNFKQTGNKDAIIRKLVEDGF
jgi:hypothetical protein